MSLALRDYQQESINALYQWFIEYTDPEDSPLVSIPTGGGKSIVIASFITGILKSWAEQRILILSHVGEILTQNYEALLAVWPEAPAGIYAAGLKRKDKRASVTFASIQSIHKKCFSFDAWDLIIIDECHLVSPKGGTIYRKFIRDAKLANPYLRVIGYTATPFRLDSGLLHEGKNRLFTHVAFDLPIKRLIDNGHLVPLISKGGLHKVNLTGVRKVAGDYQKTDLERAFYANDLTDKALDEVVTYGKDRNTWLIFCVSVSHAQDVTGKLNARGIATECIHGGTPLEERNRIFKGFRSLEIRAVASVEVMTTGVNIPNIDLLVFLRSTMSVALYLQMAGRAMRLSPETGKTNGLVLDFAGNVAKHGPIDSIFVKSKREKGEGVTTSVPTKECPECMSIIGIFEKYCPDCGYEFPPSKPFHDETATELAILSSQQLSDWHEVDFISYTQHTKQDKPDSIRVEYQCGLKCFSEWVCPEHEGFAKTKAMGWWWKRSNGILMKPTTDECLNFIEQVGIKEPGAIQVKRNGKFNEIVGHDFNTRPKKADQRYISRGTTNSGLFAGLYAV